MKEYLQVLVERHERLCDFMELNYHDFNDLGIRLIHACIRATWAEIMEVRGYL